MLILEDIKRLRVIIKGAVQGVGFRPFIYQLASQNNFRGWVTNTSFGVLLEVEGPKEKLDAFLLDIHRQSPPHSFITSLEPVFLDKVGYATFEIRDSKGGKKETLVLPDIATCPQCLEEIHDPDNRRFQYPFTNCTHCGPRYSIIEDIPYDRDHTTMKIFEMCEDCKKEYENPTNRRFHAQPNACPKCGPKLSFWGKTGKVLAEKNSALLQAASAVKDGHIVAVKGLGGFQLIVDAQNAEAVSLLRKRKHREEKPFALMYPSLKDIKRDCEVSDLEERLLLSNEAPIVLLKKKRDAAISHNVAGNNPYLGIMLAYTPLHHLLMKEIGVPVVATSGNLSEEPICIDEKEALSALGNIADFFLVHNRLIKRHVDDSIVRIIAGREFMIRRARGYAPLPISLDTSIPILSVGPHLKNTIALSSGHYCFVSQHIGNLETEKANDAFKNTIKDMQKLFAIAPEKIACDLHPDYFSTKHAKMLNTEIMVVQHHYAHILSCMAENEIKPPVLGVSWDGTGYGLDKTIWGGEFLSIKESSFDRIVHFKTFALPGGEIAVKEPRRSALGLLFSIYGEAVFDMDHLASVKAFSQEELNNLKAMLQKGLHSPATSSVGRIFDAVSSLLAICQISRFEGQAAMELEFSISDAITNETYDFKIYHDVEPTFILQILEDIKKGIAQNIISAKFHNTLVEIIIAVAKQEKIDKIALSGGCFQNKYLIERAIRRLKEEGFSPYWHQRVPTNDGGISLGQIIACTRRR